MKPLKVLLAWKSPMASRILWPAILVTCHTGHLPAESRAPNVLFLLSLSLSFQRAGSALELAFRLPFSYMHDLSGAATFTAAIS